MQRIGVFICWCGSNIAATVDVEKVAEVKKAEPAKEPLKEAPKKASDGLDLDDLLGDMFG